MILQIYNQAHEGRINMQERTIYVTSFDLERLNALLSVMWIQNKKDKEYLQRLEEGLDRANVISSQDIPADVVTINSQVLVKDLDTDKEMQLTLVLPAGADSYKGRVSILAPIGFALLGHYAGDTIECRTPGGIRRLKIEKIFYQPEAAGEYYL